MSIHRGSHDADLFTEEVNQISPPPETLRRGCVLVERLTGHLAVGRMDRT